jgi:L-seryl-tRNA(Ser) seleniumtransferase
MRSIPSIEQMRQRPAMGELEARYGRGALVDALRAEAALMRERFAGGRRDDNVVDVLEHAVSLRLRRTAAPSLRRVINATGVILHTNLGRAPLAPAAAERVTAVAAGYTNLEYDLETGTRGRRDVHAERVLCRLTGAAAAVVVNNNAAAVLLVLAATAAGREVLISRGELVEIGGGFRVPDVMTQSGAMLREVGTTNRTRTADYGAAINERTALILRVHPSNFHIVGFTERPPLAELVDLGRRFRIPVAEDLGSGYLGANGPVNGTLDGEPIVSESLAAGVDVVMFSGDKLIGGPQAGIIAGSSAVISAVRAHPLMRALRVDKLTYAALEATLEEFASGRAHATVPVCRMLALSADDIRVRADALAGALSSHGLTTSVVEGHSKVGGGSAPGSVLPTTLLAVEHPSLTASALESRLRSGEIPVVARIDADRVVLDLRTVHPSDDAAVADAVRRSLK